jgi:hypothetical protein
MSVIYIVLTVYIYLCNINLVIAAEQWTSVPVAVKLFKLIINELGTLLENSAEDTNAEDGDSDEVRLLSLSQFIHSFLLLLFLYKKVLVSPG